MQNQPASPASPGRPVLNEAVGPVQGGGYNAPATSDKNFVFKHKRLVGFIVLLALILTLLIVIASSVFFKKPQESQENIYNNLPEFPTKFNAPLPATGGEE